MGSGITKFLLSTGSALHKMQADSLLKPSGFNPPKAKNQRQKRRDKRRNPNK